MATEVWPVVVRLVPEVYVVHVLPSKRYCKTSAIVPAPPEPAVAVADKLVPTQTAPAATEGVKVPETGIALIVIAPETLLVTVGVQVPLTIQ